MTTFTAVRAGGTALAVGAATWAATLVVAPPREGQPSDVREILGGLAFQLGLAGFLLAARRTGALGRRRAAGVVLAVEAVLLAGAAVWTVVFAIDPDSQESLVMMVLDAFWPLSMLGMVPVGVLVWRARSWPDPLRRLPLLASAWLPVDLVLYAVDERVGVAFHALWLVVVWGGTGVLLARSAPRLAAGAVDGRPEQVGTATA